MCVEDVIPTPVYGDAYRLKQVLTNIIGNAVKFTSEGGVEVKVGVKEQCGNNVRLYFQVKDSGIGIPAERKQQLFEPFYQLENFMTRKPQGTGLGLAISKKLVELMQGEIWIEESDDPGTIFIFTAQFKLNNGEESNRLDQQQKKSRTSALRILIAEDNEVNQLVLSRIVEKKGTSWITWRTVLRQSRRSNTLHMILSSWMCICQGLMDLKRQKRLKMLCPRELSIHYCGNCKCRKRRHGKLLEGRHGCVCQQTDQNRVHYASIGDLLHQK